MGCWHSLDDWIDQRCAGQGRELTRHTIHTQAVREVGREFQSEQGVVKRQEFADVHPYRRIVWQFQQTSAVI